MANNELPSRSAHAGDEEAFERELSRALHSVTIPPGLQAGLTDGIRQLASCESEQSSLEPRLLHPSRQSTLSPLRNLEEATAHHRGKPGTVDLAESSLASEASMKPVLKRFQWKQWLMVASLGSAAVVLVALFFFNQPLSKEFLAAHCRATLDEIEAGQKAWSVADTSAEFWRPLKRLRLARSAQVVGKQNLAGNRFGQGVVWKLSSGTQTFYVFEFQTQHSVVDIGQQLAVIDDQSGGWSFAACSDKERIVVVAIQGEIALDAPGWALKHLERSTLPEFLVLLGKGG